MRTSHTVSMLLVGIPLFSLTGCNDQTGTATASCQSFTSETAVNDLGYLNVASFKLGQVFFVNTSTKRAGFLGEVGIPEDTTQPPQIDKTYSASLASNLSITFDANVPATVQAQATSAITSSTAINATDRQRHDVNLPTFLANNPHAFDTILSTLHVANPADIHLFVVTSTFTTSSLSMSNSKADSANLNVSIIKYGNYTLNVTYQCGSLLQQQGSNVAPFYKVTFLTTDFDKKIVSIDAAPNIDLSNFSMANAVDD